MIGDGFSWNKEVACFYCWNFRGIDCVRWSWSSVYHIIVLQRQSGLGSCWSNETHAMSIAQDNRRKARNAMTRVLSLGSAIGLVVGSVIFFNRRSLPQLFSKDPTVLAMASKALILQSVTLVWYSCLPLPSRFHPLYYLQDESTLTCLAVICHLLEPVLFTAQKFQISLCHKSLCCLEAATHDVI